MVTSAARHLVYAKNCDLASRLWDMRVPCVTSLSTTLLALGQAAGALCGGGRAHKAALARVQGDAGRGAAGGHGGHRRALCARPVRRHPGCGKALRYCGGHSAAVLACGGLGCCLGWQTRLCRPHRCWEERTALRGLLTRPRTDSRCGGRRARAGAVMCNLVFSAPARRHQHGQRVC